MCKEKCAERYRQVFEREKRTKRPKFHLSHKMWKNGFFSLNPFSKDDFFYYFFLFKKHLHIGEIRTNILGYDQFWSLLILRQKSAKNYPLQKLEYLREDIRKKASFFWKLSKSGLDPPPPPPNWQHLAKFFFFSFF